MPSDLSYKYYHRRNSKAVYLVLHGGGPEGIETPFISSIIDSLSNTGNSVFGFNFPYCERGEENSSGEELAQHNVEGDVEELAKADHSYRNEQKEPVHQGTAIKLLVGKLTEL